MIFPPKKWSHFLLHANVNGAGVFVHVDVKNMSHSDRRLPHFSRRETKSAFLIFSLSSLWYKRIFLSWRQCDKGNAFNEYTESMGNLYNYFMAVTYIILRDIYCCYLDIMLNWFFYIWHLYSAAKCITHI